MNKKGFLYGGWFTSERELLFIREGDSRAQGLLSLTGARSVRKREEYIGNELAWLITTLKEHPRDIREQIRFRSGLQHVE